MEEGLIRGSLRKMRFWNGQKHFRILTIPYNSHIELYETFEREMN